MKKMENKNKEEWQEASNSEVIKLQAGDRVEGEYLGLEESALFTGSYTLNIRVSNENKVLFVNDILKDLIIKNKISMGQQIAILYIGDKKNLKGTRSYKEYKLFFK